jgi:hypothetical protein
MLHKGDHSIMRFAIKFIVLFVLISSISLFLLIKNNVIQINKELIGQGSIVNDVIPEQEPSFEVDAETIIKEYNNNAEKADQRYKNKIVQISGIVKNKGKDTSNNQYIGIGTEKLIDARKIRCISSFDNDKTFKSIEIGSRITVKGKAAGFLLNIQIEDCAIIQ